MKTRSRVSVVGLLFLLFCLGAAYSTEAAAKSSARLGFGTSFGVGAAIPKGELWSVLPRASVGFSLSAGLRILFGKSCTEPTLFFIPYIIDTKEEGGRNGSYLSALLGMQVYPYNVLFLQPYFMFGFGFGWVSYEGPSTNPDYRNEPLQKGSGLGVPMMVGAGLDFNLYKWFSFGPTFFWNPVWWADCTIDDIYLVEHPPVCNPQEDPWLLNFWFVGLRVTFNFDQRFP